MCAIRGRGWVCVVLYIEICVLFFPESGAFFCVIQGVLQLFKTNFVKKFLQEYEVEVHGISP